MKKKGVFVTLSAIFVVLVCVLGGCGKSTLQFVKENMSEQTDVYYFGENDKFYCSISSGKREETYLMDGRSGKNVDFALVRFDLSTPRANKILKAKVSIDEVEKEVELEINSLEREYLCDLCQHLSGAEKISIEFEGQKQDLQNLSKDFSVDSEKALEIASKEMSDNILKVKSYNVLNAECYLSVMDKKANNFDQIYWCFTVLNVNNESFSIIISTKDGSVLAKN